MEDQTAESLKSANQAGLPLEAELTAICDRVEKSMKLKDELDFDDLITFLESLESGFQNVKKIEENSIKELKKITNNINKEINELQVCKHQYEKALQEATDKELKLKTEEVTAKRDLETSCAQNKALTKEIERLYEEAKPCKEDLAIIDKNRNLLRTYKDITGIKWDYTAPSASHVGIVFNPVTEYVKHFSYSSKEGEKVWNEIENAGISKNITEVSKPGTAGD